MTGFFTKGTLTTLFRTYTGCLAAHPDAATSLAWALNFCQWTRTLDRQDDEHLLLYENDVPVGILKYRPPSYGQCHLLYVLVKVEGQRKGGILLDEFLTQLGQTHQGWTVKCEIVSKDPERAKKLLVSREFKQAGLSWERQV